MQNKEPSADAPQNIPIEILQAEKNNLEKLYHVECEINKELNEKLNLATRTQTEANMEINTQHDTASRSVELKVLFDEIVTR